MPAVVARPNAPGAKGLTMFGPSLPQSLYGTLPGVEPLKMEIKRAQADPDTFASPVTVQARRRPAKLEEVQRSNLLTADNVVVFSILNSGSDCGFVPPENETKLTDGAGIAYTVKSIDVKVLGTLFSCVCVRNWVEG